MPNDPAKRKRKQRWKNAEREKQKVKNRRRRIDSVSASATPEATDPNLSDHAVSDDVVRELALRNIAQFRAAPTSEDEQSKAVSHHMKKIQDQIRMDLTNHLMQVNPSSYHICCCCGHQTHKKKLTSPSSTTRDAWLLRLKSVIYSRELSISDSAIFGSSTPSHIPNNIKFCQSCAGSLRRNAVPRGALLHGWPFNRPVPAELSSLSRHERQLISLRLPCVYVWRSQGGFGQYACRGSPVAFANPVSHLATKLPRLASKVFHILLENGKQVDVNCDKVRRALYWLKKNNPLYNEIEIDESAMGDTNVVGRACEIQGNSNPENGCNFPLNEQSPNTESEGFDGLVTSNPPSIGNVNSSIAEEELAHGTQRPVDAEALRHLSNSIITGVEDTNNSKYAELLVKHILRPFSHRRNKTLPCYDAETHLESYFPSAFPVWHWWSDYCAMSPWGLG